MHQVVELLCSLRDPKQQPYSGLGVNHVRAIPGATLRAGRRKLGTANWLLLKCTQGWPSSCLPSRHLIALQGNASEEEGEMSPLATIA